MQLPVSGLKTNIAPDQAGIDGNRYWQLKRACCCLDLTYRCQAAEQ